MADEQKTAPANFGGLEPGESNARAVRHTETKTTVEVVTDAAVAAPVADPTVTPAPPARVKKAAIQAKKKPAERTR